MSERVCAVVVTFNRRALLLECLDALRKQSRPINLILIVDNASTDGTPELLREQGYLAHPQVKLLRLERNVGGAGGFHRAFQEAHAGGFDWIWAMDDDTIAEECALERLFQARSTFAGQDAPDLLSSRVVWTDGTDHPMNQPWPKAPPREPTTPTAHANLRPLRATTFVALLLHRRCLERFGLPVAEYFIWSDDIEYTARILRTESGFLVPESVVVHKTPRKHSALGASPERFYFHVRNTLWMLLRSSAWSWAEAAPQFWSLLLVMQATFRRSQTKAATARAIIAGLRDGLLKKPTAAASGRSASALT